VRLRPTAAAVDDESVDFNLNPNECAFAPGHTVELGMAGSAAPLFRKSDGPLRHDGRAT